MNQIDIETFITLTKTRSMTKSAEMLFVSQPTVSHRIKELESELGISLLVRGKGQRRIELTPKGEEFIPIAERWLALMSETTLLQNRNDEIALRIGCPNTLNSSTLLPFYRDILKDPSLNLKLNISTHYSYNIYELLERHAIDIGFVYHLLHFKNIIVEPVIREKMYLVQEASRAIRRDRLSLEELDPRQEICFIWESNYQVWHDQVVAKGHRNYIEVDIFNLLAALLQDAGRWAIAPVSVVMQLLQQQDLVVSEIADARKPPDRLTYMIKHKDISEAKEASVSLFEKRLQNYLDETIPKKLMVYNGTVKLDHR